MVLFNHSTRELTAKIVYYGPACAGRRRTSASSTRSSTRRRWAASSRFRRRRTGRSTSTSSRSSSGNVKGYTVRFQLCTVPGQVFYNETRKLVLKGLTASSSSSTRSGRCSRTTSSRFQNLRENMAALGQSLDETAVVIQYNKRDLPGVLPIQALQESLGFQEFPFVESIAADAKGVVETFKLVSKMTFIHILKRLSALPTANGSAPDWWRPPQNSQSTMGYRPSAPSCSP
ncbi:MAG: hypothetical protein IPP07_23870 [Holophagales bacterium]|nr:hypothetical protein [Holophagales bacterium]